jgi:hypothetical protein
MGKFLDNNRTLGKGNQQSNRVLGGINMTDLPPGASFSGGGLNIPLNRKFTDSEVKNLSTANALVKDITDLKNIVKADAGKNPLQKSQFLGSGIFTLGPFEGAGKGGQAFALAKKSVGERLLRLRSGAQINEKEFQRFMAQLPSIFRDDGLDLKQLQRFEEEFNEISGRIEKGSLFNPKSNNFDISEDDIQETMRANNMSREEVLNALGVQQ